MKKIILLITILFSLIVSSSELLLHQEIADMVYDEITVYFEEKMTTLLGKELFDSINRSKNEKYFIDGSLWPDLSLSDSENRHSKMASRIYAAVNNDQSDLGEYFNSFFGTMGICCHLLEDLSCDLFWQGTLAQEYAYGDVSSFSYLTWRYNYDVIKPFNNVENFIDNHGWQAYLIRILSEKEESPKILDNTILSYSNASEKGLFEDVYKGNPSTGGAGAECFTKFWHFEDKYEYKTPKLYNWSDDYVLITEAIKNLIDAMVNNYKDGKFSIEYKDIPSIFFLDNGYSDNSETSETEAGKEYTFEKAHNEEFKFLNIKTPWLGQSSNARTECIKKSLISQLFDVKMQEYYFKYKNIYSLNQSLTNNYISLPEINVYKIDYMFFTDTSANGDLTYFKLGGVYGHKYQSYDDNFLSDKLCIGFNVSLYSVIGTELKLKNLLSDKGVNCQNDSITIFTKLYGLNIYGNRTLLDSMPFKVSIHALSIEALVCNNRPNLLYVVSKDHFISNYSVYIDLAIKMSDGQNKTFYTMNMNDFYENQILDFAAKRYNYDNDELSTYEGKRYKMQMLCTTYPVIETGLYQYIFDPEIGDLSIFQPDYRRLYSDLSSKSLINLSYQFPTGGMFVDCVQKPGDDNQVGYIRIFCPNGLKQMINNDELSTQKDNLYVYTMKSKKIEIVKLSEFINNIEYLNENDTIIFVTKGNQIQNQSKFSDFVSDIGSNIYSEV